MPGKIKPRPRSNGRPRAVERSKKVASPASAVERELEVHREELRVQNEELRRTNAELVAAKERAAQLYDVAPVGYFTIDADGVIVEANLTGADMVGARRHELFGRCFDDLIAPAERDSFRALRKRVIAGARSGIETVLSAASGVMPVHVEAAPIGIDARAMQCLLCISDETMRRRVDEERRAFDARMAEAVRLESLGLLAGGIAHDFNNVLAVALTQADLALLDVVEGSDTHESLVEIRLAVLRAADLSRQMLAYSGRGTLETAAVDLSQTVRAMESLLRASIGKGIHLELELAETAHRVWGDPVQIQQIVLNLVVNASEAIGARGGRIVVRATKESVEGTPRALLEVIDDGPGMDEQTRRRAFDPFFSTKFAGRGLGLAVVHGNVRAHDGSVALSSEPGRTAFRVSLPARVDLATTFSNVVRMPTPELSGRGCILVVDDEPAVRRAAAIAVRRLGFSVEVVENGAEAIAAVERAPTAHVAVLLDLTMPGMDGRATLRALKRLRADLPVIISSGYCDVDGDRELAAADGILPKPFGVGGLAEALRSALRPTTH